MLYGLENATMIDVSRVFLDLNNPRHEPFSDEGQAIEYLCREELVLSLARDIVVNGLNPLELFALIKEEGNSYFSAEGNRRLCALKLLNDPQLAPTPSLRSEFSRMSSSWIKIDRVFSVVFSTREEVRLWLDRIHAGTDEGRGRKQWKAEQKARNSLYAKNDLALALLDFAQKSGVISADERKGRLSTIQRYLGNPLFRNALGLNGTLPLATDLLYSDFKIILDKFFRDVISKDVTTRDNAESIATYSNTLRAIDGISGNRTERYELKVNLDREQGSSNGGTNDTGCVAEDSSGDAKGSDSGGESGNKTGDETEGPKSNLKPTPKPGKPTRREKIPFNPDIQQALQDIPSYKLDHIYYSICNLYLSSYSPLLYVGAWSFMESLTALCGRDGVDFVAYLSHSRLIGLGFDNKEDRKAIRSSLDRISDYGNATKHNKTAAGFDGGQLANDFETIDTLILALAQSVGK